MKIPEVRYVKFRSKRSFGVELEMNNKVGAKELVKIVAATDPDRAVLHSEHYVQDYNNDYWHVKFDRSCGDVENQGGWEVASYKASGYKDIDKMGKVADALKKAGVVVNKECGYHIHAEIADFTQAHAANLVAYWMKIEPIVCEMLPKHRANNKYCKLMNKMFPLGDKVYNAKDFWNIVRPQRFDPATRRVALNMCNYALWGDGRRTVELRLPECILDGKEVKNWLRFFMMFVESAKKREFPGTVAQVNLYDAMKIVGLHNEDPFFILSKGLRETKMWVMNRILTHSSKKSVREEAQTFMNALKLEKPVEKKEEAPPKEYDNYDWLWWRPMSVVD